MASGIGDYVHLTAAGYNKYGIYRWTSHSKHKGEKYSSAGVIQAEINRQKKLLEPISDNTINEMKQLLNLFYNTKNQTESQSIKRQEIINKIEEHMIKIYGNRLGDIDWDIGEITPSSLVEKEDKITILQNSIEDKIGNSKRRIDPKKVEAKIKQIDSFIKNNTKDLRERNVDVKEVVSKLNKVKNDMKKLYEEIDLTVKEDLEYYDLPQITGKNKHHTRTDEKNLRENLNDIIRLLGLAPPIPLEKGDLMEYVVAYLPYFAGHVALNQVDDNISKIKVGGAKDPVQYSLNNFKYSGSHKLGLTKGNFSLDLKESETQRKVDVSMKWGTEEVRASVKNYKLSDNTYIDTLSGSTLLFLIQDLDRNFVNHYLNLNASHSIKKEYNEIYMQHNGSDKRYEKINDADAKDSRATMKTLISLKALSGANLGRQTVNVFIINNSKTGEVEVLKVSDLLDKIQFLSASSIPVKNEKGTSIYDLKFMNNPCANKNGIERINNIIQQLHKFKVFASIRFDSISSKI